MSDVTIKNSQTFCLSMEGLAIEISIGNLV